MCTNQSGAVSKDASDPRYNKDNMSHNMWSIKKGLENPEGPYSYEPTLFDKCLDTTNRLEKQVNKPLFPAPLDMAVSVLRVSKDFWALKVNSER
eukprot:scaffold11053_cov178-Amphora_coffeaeformis.AAC.4